jgi:hypothetical protein
MGDIGNLLYNNDIYNIGKKRLQLLKMVRPTRISKANSISSSLRTTIPNDIVEYLDLKLGDVVDWEEYQEKGKKYARVRKLE